MVLAEILIERDPPAIAAFFLRIDRLIGGVCLVVREATRFPKRELWARIHELFYHCQEERGARRASYVGGAGRGSVAHTAEAPANLASVAPVVREVTRAPSSRQLSSHKIHEVVDIADEPARVHEATPRNPRTDDGDRLKVL